MTRLPAGMLVSPGAPAPPNIRRIVVDIDEFQPVAGGRVVLDVSWTLLRGEPAVPGPHAMRRFELPSGADADAQVAAMSQLVARLADAIAAMLTQSA